MLLLLNLRTISSRDKKTSCTRKRWSDTTKNHILKINNNPKTLDVEVFFKLLATLA